MSDIEQKSDIDETWMRPPPDQDEQPVPPESIDRESKTSRAASAKKDDISSVIEDMSTQISQLYGRCAALEEQLKRKERECEALRKIRDERNSRPPKRVVQQNTWQDSLLPPLEQMINVLGTTYVGKMQWNKRE